MNTFTLLNLVLSPEKATDSDLEALQELVQEYPYFQAGHLLIAKITGNSEHIKRAAAYTSERSVLMRVINSDFNPDVNLPNIDNLEIGNDDLSVFDKLRQEDQEEEVHIGKDDQFDETFGNFDFEEEDLESTSDENNETESTESELDTTTDFSSSTDLDTDTEEEDYSIETPEIDIELPDYLSNDDNNTEEETLEENNSLSTNESYSITEFNTTIEDDEEDVEHDFMDELAELRKLQAEMQKSRKEAEEALEAEEEKEKAENESQKIETPSFDTPEYEYPEYNFEEEKENKIETTDKEESSDTVEIPTEKEETPIDIIEPIETVPSDDLSFFNVKDEENSDDEDVMADIEDDKGTKTPASTSLFNFDEESLFDLDALLAEENKAIDAVKEIEERPPANIKHSSSSSHQIHAKQNNLITEFIEKSPSIKIPKDSLDKNSDDLTADVLETSAAFVSENLATIYVKQGKYAKAIDIYRQLMLKYPDKKSYFADLIESLENK